LKEPGGHGRGIAVGSTQAVWRARKDMAARNAGPIWPLQKDALYSAPCPAALFGVSDLTPTATRAYRLVTADSVNSHPPRKANVERFEPREALLGGDGVDVCRFSMGPTVLKAIANSVSPQGCNALANGWKKPIPRSIRNPFFLIRWTVDVGPCRPLDENLPVDEGINLRRVGEDPRRHQARRAQRACTIRSRLACLWYSPAQMRSSRRNIASPTTCCAKAPIDPPDLPHEPRETRNDALYAVRLGPIVDLAWTVR